MLQRKKLFVSLILILFCASIGMAQVENFFVFGGGKAAVIGSEIKLPGLIGILGDPMIVPVRINISFDPEIIRIDSSQGYGGIEFRESVSDLTVLNSTPGQIDFEVSPISHTSTFSVFFKAQGSGTSSFSITTTPDIFEINTETMLVVPWGDVNGDLNIDIVDSLLIAQYYVTGKLRPFIEDAADVNCDGLIDIIDSLVIAQYYIKEIEVLPLCDSVLAK